MSKSLKIGFWREGGGGSKNPAAKKNKANFLKNREILTFLGGVENLLEGSRKKSRESPEKPFYTINTHPITVCFHKYQPTTIHTPTHPVVQQTSRLDRRECRAGMLQAKCRAFARFCRYTPLAPPPYPSPKF